MKKIQSVISVTLFFILVLGVGFLTINFFLILIEKLS